MLEKRLIKYDWSKAIHKVTLDHGETEYYANHCLTDEEKEEFKVILESIDEQGLLPNGNPPIADILPIKKDSSFVFPFYDGCGIQMRKIFYVTIDILKLIENNEREIYTGNYNLADRVINELKQGISYDDDEIEQLRKEYDPIIITKPEDLMHGFELRSGVEKDVKVDCIKHDEVEPYIVEMLVKGGIPREHITFPNHVRNWMNEEIN